MQNYILIGGAPLTGKSTFAKSFKDHVVISTDEIRDWMKNLLKPSENADLFCDHELDANQFYEKYKNATQVFELLRKQSEATQHGVKSLMESNSTWDNIVIEGIAITPKFVNELKSNSGINIQPIFIVDDDTNRIRSRLYSRGLYDDADKYSNDLKSIELDWVIMYNQFYKDEAKKYGFRIYNLDQMDLIV